MGEKVEEAILKAPKGDMVKVEIELFSPFVNFAKQYQAFFGDKHSLEDFLRMCIYDRLEFLHNELTAFVHNEQHFLESDTWYFKYPDVATAAFKEEPEEESKTEESE